MRRFTFRVGADDSIADMSARASRWSCLGRRNSRVAINTQRYREDEHACSRAPRRDAALLRICRSTRAVEFELTTPPAGARRQLGPIRTASGHANLVDPLRPGRSDFPARQLLRALIGERTAAVEATLSASSSNIDDSSPQYWLRDGALDGRGRARRLAFAAADEEDRPSLLGHRSS